MMSRLGKFGLAIALVTGFLFAQEASAALCSSFTDYNACIKQAKSDTRTAIKAIPKGAGRAGLVRAQLAKLAAQLQAIQAEKKGHLAELLAEAGAKANQRKLDLYNQIAAAVDSGNYDKATFAPLIQQANRDIAQYFKDARKDKTPSAS